MIIPAFSDTVMDVRVRTIFDYLEKVQGVHLDEKAKNCMARYIKRAFIANELVARGMALINLGKTEELIELIKEASKVYNEC